MSFGVLFHFSFFIGPIRQMSCHCQASHADRSAIAMSFRHPTFHITIQLYISVMHCSLLQQRFLTRPSTEQQNITGVQETRPYPLISRKKSLTKINGSSWMNKRQDLYFPTEDQNDHFKAKLKVPRELSNYRFRFTQMMTYKYHLWLYYSILQYGTSCVRA